MKYLEYLLAGLPIYSTKLPSLLNEKYLSFIEKGDKIKVEHYSEEKKAEIMNYARQFCWTKRINDFIKLIEGNL